MKEVQKLMADPEFKREMEKVYPALSCFMSSFFYFMFQGNQ
jgi:hypothetical protein